MILKRLAGIFFAIAFLMALVLFANIGREYIPLPVARMIFMISGAIGLVLNLLSFQSGKNSPAFNFLYWAGSIITFAGLVFMQMHWPYGYYILLGGVAIIGASFVIPFGMKDEETNDQNDLLDN